MNIMILSVNKEVNPYPVQPLGAMYIVEALRRKGYKVKLVDLCFEENVEDTLWNNLKAFSPEIIGISIRNIDNTAYPNTKYFLPYVKKIVDFIKSKSSSFLIAGGAGFSVMPKDILAYLEVSVGIVGEGEEVICELVEKVVSGNDFRNVKGIVYIENGQYYENKAEYLKMLDACYPSREDSDVIKYYENGSVINIQSKRGCHFRCIYCTYPIIEGREIRLRSPASVRKEIEGIHEKYGIDYFFFVDSVFNYPITHAMEICDEIIHSKIKIKWTAFFHPKFITEELAEKLVKSGCSGIELGIDTASDRMLKVLKKGFSVNDVVKACSISKKAGLNICCYLLFGGPGESKETIRESFEVMAQVQPNAVIAMSGIRIYPKTELQEIALEEGYELGDCLSPRYYISEHLKEDIVELVKEYIPKCPNLIYEGITKDIPLSVLRRVRKRGIKGPLWEMMESNKRNQ